MPPTVMSDSDDTEGNDIDESKEYQNGASLNNNPSQRPGFESQENFSASSPLHSKGSSSESPQFFPPNTENTSSDGKSLQSEQLQNLIVYEEIPDEENRTSSTEHFYENIVADQQIRPGLLMQNSYHGDREERSDHDEGGKMTCAFPLYFTVYVTLLCQWKSVIYQDSIKVYFSFQVKITVFIIYNCNNYYYYYCTV